jgi:glycosyltransferase involved in cell wall biosynthesis
MKQKNFLGGLRKKRILKKDKKNLPLISVITVTLNSKKFLQQSINSVLNQSYKNYELIIIDGQSTDGTLDIIKKNNSKIDCWISEKDNGFSDAVNKGIKLSRGSIISILNSDDIFYKYALRTAVNYFNRYKYIDFIFGSVIKYKLLYGYRPWKIRWSFGFYSTHSIGFFIREKAQKKVGYYKTKYKYSPDYDFFYRMIVKHKLKGMATKKNEIFGKFRRGGIGSKLPFIDYLNETIRIRLDNGQNIFLVSIIFLLKYTRYLINKIFLIQ